MAGAGSPPAPEPREARDVMAFGQEVGRVLSDGRIVGRAEPFAKVFPSSRAVKRAVGLMAWGVLEDVALDARIDDRGRLVAETSVRRIAANTGLSKNTVTKHLATLRDHGFVFQEESREVDSGRWEACRYVLDPSACIERFTHTPTENRRSDPCPNSWDTVAQPVSQNTGHRELGRSKEVSQNQEQHQQTDVGSEPQPRARARKLVPATAERGGNGPAGGGERSAAPATAAAGNGAAGNGQDLTTRLQDAGVAGDVAEGLVGRYPPQRINEALAAALQRQPDNPPGWIVTALSRNWDLAGFLAQQRAGDASRERVLAQEAALAQARCDTAEERSRSAGWSGAVSAALDAEQLAAAMATVATPVDGLERHSVPLARAQLIAWAVAVHASKPGMPLAEALTADLAAPCPTAPDLDRDGLPAPPATGHPPDLSARIGAHLQDQEQQALRSPTGRTPTPQKPRTPAPPTREEPDHGLEL